MSLANMLITYLEKTKLMNILIILKTKCCNSRISFHKDIEKQVILAGNKDIPELIETVIKSLKK